MVERLILTMTGLMTKVRHIRFVEAVDALAVLPEMGIDFVKAIGFGEPLDWFGTDAIGFQMTDPYYKDAIAFAGCRLYGVTPDQIRFESSYAGYRQRKTLRSEAFRSGRAAQSR
jgi:hypothetical protein